MGINGPGCCRRDDRHRCHGDRGFRRPHCVAGPAARPVRPARAPEPPWPEALSDLPWASMVQRPGRPRVRPASTDRCTVGPIG